MLGTALHGCLLSAIQFGAPEHTLITIKKYSGDHNNNNNIIIISLNFFDVHMHSVFPSPASPTYPLRHGPHVCSGVDKEHSSRPIELQSGTSVQSKAEISHELISILYVV